jgi:hypothetical protein
MFDPFDFSDFGSSRPNGQNGQSTLQPSRPESKLTTGFDPFGQSSARPAQPVDAFGVTTHGLGQQDLAVGRPPLGLFGLAIVLAVAGALIAGVWGGAFVAAAVGWSLAGPVAIGVLAFYTLVDTRRRTDAVYSAPSWTGAAYWVVVAACLSGIAIGAWHLALWAGRQ